MDLMWKIDPSKSTYNWEYEGEVHIKLRKHPDNPVQYWERLLKEPSTDWKVQTWWEMKDEHVDAVEDLAV